MTDYEEYPITLTHPAYQPARIVKLESGDSQGSPEKYPPVTAGNALEEEYYKAEGYQRAGKIDPSAWVRQQSSAPPETYVPQEYPKWVDGVLVEAPPEGEQTVAEAAPTDINAMHAELLELKAKLAEAERRKGGRPRKLPTEDQMEA